jgi:preprotein translocase subunit SecB
MTVANTIESGYVLEALFFPVQQLSPATHPTDRDVNDVSWGWDWRWNDHDHFEVGLLFGAHANDARPEKLEVAATAVFRVVGESQTVPVVAFAYAHAPALLFPYVRQVVDELTSRSPHGRVLLPPTNVLALMANFVATEAVGAKQERPAAV